jgi:D-alanyl-D-alanine carboxypeptidase/D-alanyl-D-alanine-endopeptidase (penicillin-binding protein 4)
LDQILSDSKLDGAIVSAYVCELDGDKVFEKNAALHVVPASNQKLLSNAFALHTLGPDYTPVTRIWKERKRTFVSTTGDPMLTYQQLVEARSKLKLNRSLPVHVQQPYAPGIPDTWEFDDLPNKYAAPITAFTVDRGSFELWHKGGKIVAVPSSYGVQIYASRGSGPLQITYDPMRRMVTVDGKWPEKDARVDTLSIWRPDREAAFLLGSGFIPSKVAPAARPSLTISGKPVSEMIAACLQPSDNNIAEQLLLLGALRVAPLPAKPYPAARQRLTDFLEKVVGVQKGDIKPYDGSGMSRHNYVTTRGLAKVLQWSNDQATAPYWRSALASPGKGTLANRLKEMTFQGKTGTLDMVSALSGYVRHKSGQDLIVSVVLNQYACTAAEARDVLDTFVKYVAAADLTAREGAKNE